jgi:bifunctional UDP-N-acetylglucosamine pyrophosphorylase/glucosamine-1-phosphate N-acetyltransferase
VKTYAIVLAAGKGTRMRTELPKCAYPILKKPMIEYIIEHIEFSDIDETVCVVGHKKETIEDILKDRVKYAVQEEQLGTGHAVLMAEELLRGKEGNTIIMLGDMPLVDQGVINNVLEMHQHSNNDLTVLTTTFDNPYGYGRIIRDKEGHVEAIVEQNDCTAEQKMIKEINTGIYVVNNLYLFEAVKKIKLNPRKKEYYLTDIIAIMKEDHKVGAFELWDSYKVMGVNDLYSISIAEKHLRDHINKRHMLQGVSIINPETVTIGHNVAIEGGAIIYPNTYITGNTVIKKGSKVGPNTEVHDSLVHENVRIKHSLVFDSEIHKNTVIGPFAHLRNGAVIGEDNRIGNFVEVKKSTTGKGTKAAHLAYIGDATTGKNVNFGCGSITVNYDGVNKNQTVIGNDVFIGCNTNLVAPVTIGDKVFIAAGSTVTRNVPKGALAIARNKQINKEDYAKNFIRPKDDE